LGEGRHQLGKCSGSHALIVLVTYDLDRRG
jgi:hypothetical protein